MPEILAVLLALVWAAGCLSAHRLGGGIHLLLLAAAIIVAVRLLQRDPL